MKGTASGPEVLHSDGTRCARATAGRTGMRLATALPTPREAHCVRAIPDAALPRARIPHRLRSFVLRAPCSTMVSPARPDAGYQYVVIDDCWSRPRPRRCKTPRNQVAGRALVLQPRLFGEALDRFLLLGAEFLWQRDVRLHVHVAAPAIPFYAVPRDAEFLTMLRSRRNP